MVGIIDFLKNNYSWIFDGVGALIVMAIIGYYLKDKNTSSNKVTQKNIKAKGDVVGRDKNS